MATNPTCSEVRDQMLATRWKKPVELAEHLELGDLVEFKRNRYEHWGIYIGMREELGNKKEFSSKLIHGSTAEVRSDPFSISPFPPKIIVDRALQKLGTGDYNLLHNNCEHFAKWCRYGSKESKQATICQTALIGVTTLAFTGSFPMAVTAGTLGLACIKYIPLLHQAIVMRSFI
uniref:LRAT domain-containing protein n=1 Tax=Ditylenchus dipsaci TaxID=166011 RepID=A0A915EDU2_9BILA